MEDNLINLMRAKIAEHIHDMVEYPWSEVRIRPKLKPDALQIAEKAIGVQLPSLLTRIYLEVGNGGFGPGYGLLPIYRNRRSNGMIEVYESFINRAKQRHCIWPAGIVPICTWGCGIYSFVDCLDQNFPVVVFDGNLSFEYGEQGEVKLITGAGKVLPLYHRNVIPDSTFNMDQDYQMYPLISHKATFSEWINDWISGVNLWDDMGL